MWKNLDPIIYEDGIKYYYLRKGECYSVLKNAYYTNNREILREKFFSPDLKKLSDEDGWVYNYFDLTKEKIREHLGIIDYGININKHPEFYTSNSYFFYKTLEIQVDKTKENTLELTYEKNYSSRAFLLLDSYLKHYSNTEVTFSFEYSDKIDIFIYMKNNSYITCGLSSSDYNNILTKKIILSSTI